MRRTPFVSRENRGGQVLKTESQMSTTSPLLSLNVRRSSRVVRKPVRFGDYFISKLRES